MKDNRFKPLPWTKLKRDAACYLPKVSAPSPVSEDSPAIDVMTDFRFISPVTIPPDATLDDANRIMKLCGAYYLLVADERRCLLGLVTEAGAKGHRPLATAHAKGVRPSELVVGDVMIDKHDDAEVLHLKDVVAAKVGHIVSTLKAMATPYCLVVDHDVSGDHSVCGIFSLTQIERQLGVKPQAVAPAHTFSQVVSSLNH